MVSCILTECRITWTPLYGQNSLNGVLIPEITSVYKCLGACEQLKSCVGVDLDVKSDVIIGCWLHLDQADFSTTFTTLNRAQFRLKRCPTAGKSASGTEK